MCSSIKKWVVCQLTACNEDFPAVVAHWRFVLQQCDHCQFDHDALSSEKNWNKLWFDTLWHASTRQGIRHLQKPIVQSRERESTICEVIFISNRKTPVLEKHHCLLTAHPQAAQIYTHLQWSTYTHMEGTGIVLWLSIPTLSYFLLLLQYISEGNADFFLQSLKFLVTCHIQDEAQFYKIWCIVTY